MSFKPRSKYSYENAPEDSAVSISKKRHQRNQFIVKRLGDIPKNCGRVVTVTRSQKEAYQAISAVIEARGSDRIAWNSVREAGVREATLMALIKKQLIDVEYDAEVGDVFIKQWRYKPSDQEIMEEGGVGSILIKIGVG